MPDHHYPLLDTMRDPLALVSRAGEIRATNSAFHELARRDGNANTLEALFGVGILPHLVIAAEDGHALAALPLVVGPEPPPWLRVTLSRDDAVDGFWVLLVDVSDEAELRRRQHERDGEIRALREIGAALSGSLELDAITDRVCEQVGTLARTVSFFVALYDRQNQIISFPRYLEEGTWRERTSRPFSNGLTEYVIRTGAPLLLNGDVVQQAGELGAAMLGRPCRAWLGVPMTANGEVLGVIATQNYTQSDCFHRDDVEIMSVIAGQAAAAIKNALLLATARRAYDELAEAQARLLESERVRGITEAVGSMNHEINNPLAAIVGNAQLLLRRKDALVPESVAKIESILDAARRIQEVTVKMSTLIQATSMPYPGHDSIIDLRASVAEGDTCFFPPTRDPTRR